MNLAQPVDDYCERLGPGLMAEPLNAVSNLAFFAASMALLMHLRRRPGAPMHVKVLAALIFAVGLGSLAFHTFANVGTEILDVLFIAVFVHFFVACFVHRVFAVRWVWAWLAIPGFAVYSWLLGLPFPADALNGSISYLPAFTGLLAMAAILAARREPAARTLGAAALVFLVSATLRTFDRAWCPALPIGTHWVWHCLNAVVLSLATLSLAQPLRQPEP